MGPCSNVNSIIYLTFLIIVFLHYLRMLKDDDIVKKSIFGVALHPSSLRRTHKYALYNTSQYCGLYEQLLIVKSSLSRLLWLWQTDYVLEELIP